MAHNGCDLGNHLGIGQVLERKLEKGESGTAPSRVAVLPKRSKSMSGTPIFMAKLIVSNLLETNFIL